MSLHPSESTYEPAGVDGQISISFMTPSPSSSNCDSEHPSKFTASPFGVFGHKSSSSIIPSPSVSVGVGTSSLIVQLIDAQSSFPAVPPPSTRFTATCKETCPVPLGGAVHSKLQLVAPELVCVALFVITCVFGPGLDKDPSLTVNEKPALDAD